MRVALLAALLLMAPSARGASRRMDARTGIHTSFLGDPFPSLLGINVSYQYTDFLRFQAGISAPVAPLVTFGAGAKFFVPDWNLSPTLGLHWGQILLIFEEIDQYDRGAPYLSLGWDWASEIGCQIAVGMNLAVRKHRTASKGLSSLLLPHINLGWAF